MTAYIHIISQKKNPGCSPRFSIKFFLRQDACRPDSVLRLAPQRQPFICAAHCCAALAALPSAALRQLRGTTLHPVRILPFHPGIATGLFPCGNPSLSASASLLAPLVLLRRAVSPYLFDRSMNSGCPDLPHLRLLAKPQRDCPVSRRKAIIAGLEIKSKYGVANCIDECVINC